MTELYAASLHTLSGGEWKSRLPALDPDRRIRALACRKEADSVRIVGAGLLLQQVLQHHGVPVDQQNLERNAYGKPYLANWPELHFSLSHCSTWAVCALADHPVGVDAELPRCSAPLARRYFHPEEAMFAEEPDTLCRIWTAKEAFLKALGIGLTVPLNSFLVRLEQNQLQLHQTHTASPYRLHEYSVDDVRICLCCMDEKLELTLL